MNRRDVIAALPAACLAGSAPAAVSAAETSVMALFREWQRTFEASCVATEDECSRLPHAFLAIEARMREVPSQDARDVIAKMVAYSNYGVFDLGDEIVPDLWAEARALIGG